MKATAIAHPNIALVKYWGKRDRDLNLPAAGSLSLTLGPMHTRTTVAWGQPQDTLALNGRAASAKETARVSGFLDLIREQRDDLGGAAVESANDFPTAAGLASSSSAFAALATAAVAAAEIEISDADLSVLSRRGSGSAARSIFSGFARMDPGELEDGTDAHAHPIASVWDLRVVIAVTTAGAKKVSSGKGMNHTEETSPYYDAWIDTVPSAIVAAEEAIEAQSFETLGMIAEASAMQMHASAIAAVPAVLYWKGTTVDVIHAVRSWREAGEPVFFTIDAGPHVKIFTTAEATDRIVARTREIPGIVDVIVAEPARGAYVVDG